MLRRPDVWPPGDVALLRSCREVFADIRLDQAEIARQAETWRPYRSVAARLLWHAYLCERGRSAPGAPADDPHRRGGGRPSLPSGA